MLASTLAAVPLELSKVLIDFIYLASIHFLLNLVIFWSVVGKQIDS